MSKLDALKAQFAQKTNSNYDESWKKFYSFWKMPDDTTAVIRFLPDADADNPMGFLVENLVHELVVNGDKKKVACASMFGEACPICELSRKYYDEKNEDMGKKYYRKKSYIGQVLVVESPIEHDQNQLVKLIDFGPKIFKTIQAAFQSGDLEEAPYELKGGYNFRIKKTKAGQYADYGTSSFQPKQTDIDDNIVNQLELFDLKDYRAKQVDSATLSAMLMADQTGQPLAAAPGEAPSDNDTAMSAVKAAASAPAQESAPAKVETPVDASAASAASAPAASAPAPSEKAATVLEQLRARAAAKKAEG